MSLCSANKEIPHRSRLINVGSANFLLDFRVRPERSFCYSNRAATLSSVNREGRAARLIPHRHPAITICMRKQPPSICILYGKMFRGEDSFEDSISGSCAAGSEPKIAFCRSSFAHHFIQFGSRLRTRSSSRVPRTCSDAFIIPTVWSGISVHLNKLSEMIMPG